MELEVGEVLFRCCEAPNFRTVLLTCRSHNLIVHVALAIPTVSSRSGHFCETSTYEPAAREREFPFRRIKSVGSEQRCIPKFAGSGVRPRSEI